MKRCPRCAGLGVVHNAASLYGGPRLVKCGLCNGTGLTKEVTK